MATPAAGTTPYDREVDRAITLLLEMYKENTTHGRHLENQRQLVAGFILTITAATFGALATLKFPKGACVGFGLVLAFFGAIGAIFSVVQYGKYNQSRVRWRGARQRLTELCPHAELGSIYEASKPGAEPSNARTGKTTGAWLKAGDWPLHWLWTLLMLAVFILGLVLFMLGLFLFIWCGC